MKTVTLTAEQWESLHHWAFEGLDYRSYWFDHDCAGDPEMEADLSASMQKGWQSLEKLREQIDRRTTS